MIEIQELTKYYGARKAVGPLSFRIEQGEVLGLLGLNGAGKTTTLRMLSSDLLPTSGRMVIDGVDLAEEPEKVQPRIGYLPDRPPLYGEMTVREYLRFAARLRGMERSDMARRVDEVISITDIGPYATERIDTLSHGYRQRVGIAQAIVHQPALLLLDEPISGLDPVQIVEMRELVKSLRGDHTTILSSHILSEISETCDRLLIIRDGEIIASGTEDELVTQMRTVGMSFSLTVRLPEEAERSSAIEMLEETIGGIDEVDGVALGSSSAADQVVLNVAASSDVRDRVVRAVVLADFGVLGIERTSRELESAFIELTGETVAEAA